VTGSVVPWRAFLASAGLIASPLAWAINMELSQILPYADCRSRVPFLALTSAAAIGLALAGGFLSWQRPWPGPTGRFVSQLGVLTSLVFIFALLLQLVAGAMLMGCEV
jgi:hypothetical protein